MTSKSDTLILSASLPPVPTSYPPVPTSYPPVPTSYPPVPTSYPPVSSFSAKKNQTKFQAHRNNGDQTWELDLWSQEGSLPTGGIRLSVVIVARNEAAHLRRTLEGLIKGAPVDTDFRLFAV